MRRPTNMFKQSSLELERELQALTCLVESDPAARDRSIELGRLVMHRHRHARGMRQAYVEAQRQAEEAAREEIAVESKLRVQSAGRRETRKDTISQRIGQAIVFKALV